jgi:hypothetical protein
MNVDRLSALLGVDAPSAMMADIAAEEETIGWITQNNGKNFDIYCSKKCAS